MPTKDFITPQEFLDRREEITNSELEAFKRLVAYRIKEKSYRLKVSISPAEIEDLSSHIITEIYDKEDPIRSAGYLFSLVDSRVSNYCRDLKKKRKALKKLSEEWVPHSPVTLSKTEAIELCVAHHWKLQFNNPTRKRLPYSSDGEVIAAVNHLYEDSKTIVQQTISTKEAVERYGVTSSWLYSMRRSGKLKSIKSGNLHLWFELDIIKILSETSK